MFWAPENLKTISGSKDEGRKSSCCLTDGHLSFEECQIGGKAQKIQKVELHFEATLCKTILDLMQYSLNKNHQHVNRTPSHVTFSRVLGS